MDAAVSCDFSKLADGHCVRVWGQIQERSMLVVIKSNIRNVVFLGVFWGWVKKSGEKVNFFCFFGVKLGETDYNSCAPHL